MISVYVSIASPDIIFAELNIKSNTEISHAKFTQLLKAELFSALSNYHIKNIQVKINHNYESTNSYEILLENTKNDWQEESIREECDITCIKFLRKENLITIYNN